VVVVDPSASTERQSTNFRAAGANDGVKNDPIREVLAKNLEGLRALLMEPVAYNFDRLKVLYNNSPQVTLMRAAVAEPGSCVNGQITFYRANHTSVPQNAPPFVKTQIGALSDKGLLVWTGKQHVVKELVDCRDDLWALARLAGFLVNNEPVIDFLQIDAEGYDFNVIRALSEQTTRLPFLIHFESRLLEQEWQPAMQWLLERGYYLRANDWECTFAIDLDRIQSHFV